LQDANEAAALFYHSLLQTSERARAYLEERGVDSKTAGEFQLGYAPPGWDSLRAYLTARSFTDEQLVEAGLLVQGDRSPYDRFRDRLVFPIRDDRGRVVGFGGRVLPGGDSGDGPKYVNTPQSPVFDKGAVLYGLDRAKDAVRQSGVAVVVEGYMDVIAAHQFGHRNVVASMGTALTERQVSLMERFASERVVIAMDADSAGNEAALKDVMLVVSQAKRRGNLLDARGRVVLEQGLRLDWRIATIPIGKDPDELIRNDPSAWTTVVESALPLVEHYLRVKSAGKEWTNSADRQEILNQMGPILSALPSSEQMRWVQRVARGSRAAEEYLWRQIRTKNVPRRSARESLQPEKPTSAASERLHAPREVFCLALLYRFPALSELGMALDEDLFTLSENRELLRRWKRQEGSPGEDSELRAQYETVMAVRVPVAETAQAEKAFLDCVRRLQHARMRAAKEASALALAEGEAGVRPGRVASIARARMGAGNAEESSEDGQAESVASQLLEDMEAGLRFHRSLIEGIRPEPNR